MVELSEVLLLAGNAEVRVGTPAVAGARVIAEVVDHVRSPKLIVFKYKSKTRYRRRKGHRQDYTRLAVREILTAETPAVEAAEPEAKPARRTRRPKVEPDAQVAEDAAQAEPSGTATPVEEAAAPARRARRKVFADPAAPTAAPEAEEAPARPRARRRVVAIPDAPAAEATPVEAAAAAEETKPARRTRAARAATPAKAEAEREPADEGETPSSGE